MMSHPRPEVELSLLEQLGADAVDLIVEQFYDRTLADPRLAPFFEGIDLTRLVYHQKTFFYMALGADNTYTGRALAIAHQGLGIKQQHMDALVEHLEAALNDYAVEADMIQTIITKITSFAELVIDETYP
ncbi:MAG: group 1 truncated hemoglobin [Deinococcota bacterium]